MSNLTIRKEPGNLMFNGNEVVFQIQTSNAFSNSGMTSMYEIAFNGDPAADDTIELKFMNRTLLFIFKSSPDESGLQLPLRGTKTWDAYFDDLVAALKSNYYLDMYYTVTAGGTGGTMPYYLYIQSKEKGAIYTIDFTVSSTNVSMNERWFGEDIVLRTNYRIIIRTLLENEIKGEDWLQPFWENTGITLVETGISDYLKGLESSFPFPGTTGQIIHASDDLKKAWIEYAEYYDTIVKKVYSSESTAYVYLLNGGLDTRKIAELNEDSKTVLEYIRDRKDFLTNRPIYNKVLMNQQEMLSYIVLDNQVSTLNVIIEATWDDGSVVKQTAESGSVSLMDLKDFDVTPFRLELDTWDPTSGGNWPYKYKVWLEDGAGNMLTIGRTYEIVEKTRYDHQFIFRNSYGRYDTVRLTGKGERNSEQDRERITHRRDDADLLLKQFQLKSNGTREQQTLKLNSGYLNKVNAQPEVFRDYLREFAMSREIYEVVNGDLYPSLVISDSLVTQKDGEQLQYVEFELIRAYTDEHYVRDKKLIPDQFFTEEFNERFVT